VSRGLERLIGPLASKIITVSEFDRRFGVDAHLVAEDRVVTVHNGMPDIGRTFRADPKRAPARLVMVARFEPQKDHATLLRALGALQAHSWELDLIGDGPLRSEMESLAASLGISGRVRFLGQRTDVDQILARAQVSVLVSNWEGFPLSILEAMRAGLPIVATSVGGVDEAVRDEDTGYVVPRGDVDRLRERIEELLISPALRAQLGGNGRARYEQHFTLDHLVAKTLAVYQDVLDGRNGRVPARPQPESAGSTGGATAGDQLHVGG
jgi:glycosyltransferase involved in cell wall biosynthesis